MLIALQQPQAQVFLEPQTGVVVLQLPGGGASPALSPAERAAAGEVVQVVGYSVNGTPDSSTQAKIDALLELGWPETSIWWNWLGEASGGVSGALGGLSLSAPSTLALGTLAGVGNGNLGTIGLSAPATINLGTLTAAAAGSASLGALSLSGASSLNLGTLSGVQNAAMGALSLTAPATLALGALSGSSVQSGSLGALSLGSPATLAMGTLVGVGNASLGALGLTGSATLALGTLAAAGGASYDLTQFISQSPNGWDIGVLAGGDAVSASSSWAYDGTDYHSASYSVKGHVAVSYYADAANEGADAGWYYDGLGFVKTIAMAPGNLTFWYKAPAGACLFLSIGGTSVFFGESVAGWAPDGTWKQFTYASTFTGSKQILLRIYGRDPRVAQSGGSSAVDVRMDDISVPKQ